MGVHLLVPGALIWTFYWKHCKSCVHWVYTMIYIWYYKVMVKHIRSLEVLKVDCIGALCYSSHFIVHLQMQQSSSTLPVSMFTYRCHKLLTDIPSNTWHLKCVTGWGGGLKASPAVPWCAFPEHENKRGRQREAAMY